MKYCRFVFIIGVLLMTILFSCSNHKNDDDDNDDSGDDDNADDDDYLPEINENWSYDIIDKWAADNNLSLDLANNVYIYYYDPARTDGKNELFYTTNLNNWAIQKYPIDVKLSTGFSSSALSSAIGPNDELHLLYAAENESLPTYELFYAIYENGSWLTACISDTIARNPSPSLAIDEGGNVHISYYEGAEEDNDLIYVNNTSGMWQYEIVESGAGKETYRHSIIKVSNGIVYFAYIGLATEANKNKVIVAKITEMGLEKTIITEDVGSLSMDVDETGSMHIACYNFSTPRTISYISDCSGEWETSIVANDFAGSSISIAVDANQKGHIVHSGINNAETKLGAMYVNNSSGDWCSEEIFTDDADIISMAIDGDNKIHVAMNAGSYLVHLTREIP